MSDGSADGPNAPGPGPEPFEAPVTGGNLRGGIWGAPASDLPPVVAIHGITSNHLGWAKAARHLVAGIDGHAPRALLAPDLRGRVLSASLPGTTGIRRHVADLIAVMDHRGIERTILAGHSMGAWVAAMLAVTAPERVAGLVLVDGGVSGEGDPLAEATAAGASPQDVVDAVLGPAVARLSKTYPSREAYLAEWAAHPAFLGGLDRDTREVLLADLTGSGFAWRSSVREDAVRTDGAELLIDGEVRDALLHSMCPAIVVRAERGLLDEPNPLLPRDVVEPVVARRPQTRLVDVPGSNHYTVLLAEPGATVVAQAIASLST